MKIELLKIIEDIYKDKSELYLNILQNMKENNIEFIIINLPIYYKNNKVPNDIDLILDNNNFNKAREYLLNKGFVKLDRYINSKQEAYIFFYPDKCEFIRIHIHLNFTFYGVTILTYNDIKKYTFESNNFLYPNKIYNDTILLFESFFRKKFHYYDRIRIEDNESTSILFHDYKAKKLFNTLFVLYKKKLNVTTLQQVIIMLSIYKVHILKYLVKKVLLNVKKINFLKRKGKLIFIIGVDGSGKSTISKKIVEKIESGGYLSRYAYWGLKVTMVQKIKQIFSKRNKNNKQYGVKSNYMKLDNGISDKINKKSKFFGSIFYFLLSVVYILDYWTMIFKDLTFISSENNFLIIDRTYYDKLFDTNKFANKLFYYLLPKPDFIFMLNGDLDIFYNRKREFDMKNLQVLNKRIYDIIKFCKTKNIDIYEVDTTKHSIKDSVCKIVKYLWEKS